MIRSAALGVLLVGLLATACTPPSTFDAVDAVTGRSVSLSLGALRAPQTFSGSYASPQVGALELRQDGDRIAGTWRDVICGCAVSGSLSGTIDGNRARFDFTETYGGCEDARSLQGRGFLFYQSYAQRGAGAELYGRFTYTSPKVSYALRYTATADVAYVVTARAAGASGAPALEHCP